MPITETLTILVFCRTLKKKAKLLCKKTKKKRKPPIKTQAATQPVPYNTTKGKKLKFILMYVHR
jgi:hypothetical protein